MFSFMKPKPKSNDPTWLTNIKTNSSIVLTANKELPEYLFPTEEEFLDFIFPTNEECRALSQNEIYERTDLYNALMSGIMAFPLNITTFQEQVNHTINTFKYTLKQKNRVDEDRIMLWENLGTFILQKIQDTNKNENPEPAVAINEYLLKYCTFTDRNSWRGQRKIKPYTRARAEHNGEPRAIFFNTYTPPKNITKIKPSKKQTKEEEINLNASTTQIFIEQKTPHSSTSLYKPASTREMTKELILTTLWGENHQSRTPSSSSACGQCINLNKNIAFEKPHLNDIKIELNEISATLTCTVKNQSKTNLTLKRKTSKETQIWTCNASNNAFTQQMRFQLIAAESLALRLATMNEKEARKIGIADLENARSMFLQDKQHLKCNPLSQNEFDIIKAHIDVGYSEVYYKNTRYTEKHINKLQANHSNQNSQQIIEPNKPLLAPDHHSHSINDQDADNYCKENSANTMKK